MFQQLYDQWMLGGVHETTAAGNPKPPPPELFLEWVLEAWYDGVTKDNAINSFRACGIGYRRSRRPAPPHSLPERRQRNSERAAAEAQELVDILAGFEIEAPDEDYTGHVNDAKVIDDEAAASDDERSGSEDENHNLCDDSDF
ncbi:hypothetical protein AAVH_15818 [Aphelenchoides avenae]|nr:hypothetical protein AAVH_15818 [Aphelenchus avenae]